MKLDNNYFEILVNDGLFYQYLYNSVNFDIADENSFESELSDFIRRMDRIKITFIIYNINICEYNNYYKFFKVR